MGFSSENQKDLRKTNIMAIERKEETFHSLCFFVATPLSLSLSSSFSFFPPLSPGREREEGEQSKEEEKEDQDPCLPGSGSFILPFPYCLSLKVIRKSLLGVPDPAFSFSLLCLIKSNQEISPGSSGSCLLPFPYSFLLKVIKKTSPGSSGSCFLLFLTVSFLK